MARTGWYRDHPPSCTCWRCNEGRRRGQRDSGGSLGKVAAWIVASALVAGAVWLVIQEII